MAPISKLTHTLLFMAVSTMLVGCSDNSPEGRLRAAKAAIHDADNKAAIIELKNILQIAPNNIEARLLLGQSLQDQEQWADSEKHLKQALQLGAPQEQVLPWLARTMVKMGRYQDTIDLQVPKSGIGAQAMAALQAERANAFIFMNQPREAGLAINEGEQALISTATTEPSPNLQVAKAGLLFISKQPDKAISLLNEVLQHNPNNVEALYTKAQFLLNENKEAEALKSLQQIIAVRPKEIMAQIAISDIYLHAGNLAASEAAIKVAESVSPNLPRVQYSRAKLELRKGNLAKANETVQKILRVAPGHLPSVLLGSAINYGLGHYEQSLLGASQVLAQLPGEPFATKLVAANQLKNRDYKAASETLSSGLQRTPDDAELLTMTGELYLHTKDYTKALQYLDRAATKQPKDQQIKQKIAQGYMAMGQFDRGLSELRHAVDLSDKASNADTALITVYLAKKDYDNALLAISAFDKKLPNNPVSHVLRATALIGKNDRAAARKALEKALELQPKYFPAVANLGRMDVEDKLPDQARKRYEAFLEKDINNADAMMALARLALTAKQDGDYRKWLERAAKAQPRATLPRASLVDYFIARREYTRALSIAREVVTENPKSAEALALLGRAQLASGEQKNALATLTQVTVLSPDSAESYYQLGSAQLAAKRLPDSRASLESALTLEPEHPRALIKLHQLLLQIGENATAAQRFTQLQKQHAGNPAVQFYVAQCHQASGRNREAIALYESILPKLPGNAAAMNNLANLYYMEKDGRALSMAEQAYNAVPNNVDVLDTLGWILTEKGQHSRAIELLRNALSKAPKASSIRYHYAVALSRGGNKVEARKELEKLVNGGQKFPELTDAKKLLASL